MTAGNHGQQLFESAVQSGMEDRFRHLVDCPPVDWAAFHTWLDKSELSDDPLFFSVINLSTGRAEGRQALMRIDPFNGVIEIGEILWGPVISRSRIATEALFLAARHVFDDLGYRRLEWRCDNRNEPSKASATRFGFSFEGVFRNHMTVKVRNRDTASFAITDGDWKVIRPSYETWLSRDNFSDDGLQLTKLGAVSALESHRSRPVMNW